MKVVLVKPPATLEEIYEGLSSAGSELPPWGVAALASVVRDSGHEVEIVDATALKLSVRKTVEKIIAAAPGFVGVTAMTPDVMTAAAVARGVKEAGLGVPVALGGPHVTSVPEETLKRFPEFDFAAIGEGEDTIVDLLAVLRDGGELSRVGGLLIRDREGLVRTPARAAIEDLDSLPFPAWDLLPHLPRFYRPPANSLNRFPGSLLVTSRGCPFQCVFCDRSVFGNRVRGFSAGYVVEMMRHLRKRYGILDDFIADDNFLSLKRRTVEICEMLTAERLDVSWTCLARVDVVKPELLRLMKRAGCWQILYGCESGAQEVLDAIGKKVKLERIEQAIRWTREAGIDAKGFFMAGSFGETRETMEKTIAYLRRVPLTDFHMTSFTPLPGSEAYETAHKWGEFNPSWEKMGFFSADVFVPAGLTREEIQAFMRRAFRTFYLRPDVILHYAKKLTRPRLYPKLFAGLLGFARFALSRKSGER